MFSLKSLLRRAGLLLRRAGLLLRRAGLYSRAALENISSLQDSSDNLLAIICGNCFLIMIG